MQPALVILDPQKDFFDPDNPNLPAFLETVPVINHAAAFFCRRGWPVVFVLHTSQDKPYGSEPWQIYEQFDRGHEDLVITKTRPNAFEGSTLQQALEDAHARRIVLAGYLAEHCIRATYQAAQALGYSPLILQDGTAGLESVVSPLETDPEVDRITAAGLQSLIVSTTGENPASA